MLLKRSSAYHASSLSGGFAGGATPDPIPNSEVKPSRADGTARSSVWESRSPPESFWEGPRLINLGPFLFRMIYLECLAGGRDVLGQLPR